MPYAMIACLLGVFFGGLLGKALSRWITDEMRTVLPWISALTAIGSGIVSVVKADQFFVVSFAVIVGSTLGHVLRLEKRVYAGLHRALEHVPHPADFDMEQYVTIVAIFCTSGFGMYAVMVESFSGDHAQMISKALMDFFIAVLFGSSMGVAVSLVAIPQGVIFVSLYFLAKVLMPYLTGPMEANFIACGGLLTMAAGMRMSRIKMFPLIDMLPSLVLVMPLTKLWLALLGG